MVAVEMRLVSAQKFALMNFAMAFDELAADFYLPQCERIVSVE